MRVYSIFFIAFLCFGCAGNSHLSNKSSPQLSPDEVNFVANDFESELTHVDDSVFNSESESTHSNEFTSSEMLNSVKTQNMTDDSVLSLQQSDSGMEMDNQSQDDYTIVDSEQLDPQQDVLSYDNIKSMNPNAEWFIPDISQKWYRQVSKKANRSYLSSYFEAIGYHVPKDTYALIAPLEIRDGQFMMQYYSYKSTAFVYSMTKDGHENFWPASTVKLAAAVMALLKLSEYGTNSQAIVKMTDIEGNYENNVEKLCREAIIPSNNTAYNRLMEIAGFDEINDHYLREVFHFPKMVLQRRYQRANPDDNLRYSPSISFHDNKVSGMIPERKSSGKMRPECPRESNCATLAELAEVMFRVVLHEELNVNRRLKLAVSEINMLRDALKKAPSCIGDGVAQVMGTDAIIYNKGGKVFADDRLEIAVVSSSDKKERYLIALSMPYYDGVETETNRLARLMIEAMRLKSRTALNHSEKE